MKKVLYLNITALLCAAAIFSTSAVYAASRMDKLESVPVSSRPYQDDFEQEKEPGIADLLSSGQEEVSSLPSSAASSPSSAQSSEASSAVSSDDVKGESSRPAASSSPSSSSQPAESQPPSSSQEEPALPDPPPEQVVEWPTIEFIFDPGWLTSSSEEVESSPSTDVGAEDTDALLDLVAGAVQREIVGVNTTPSPQYYEAYKAQAVACHSYMEYHRLRTGSYPSMSYTTPDPKTVELVREVLDELMYYDGNVINAAYHAASGGHTQSASYVWGNAIPYLQGVQSAYDDYERTYAISVAEMESKLLSYGLNPSSDPSEWFDLSSATYTDGGFVNTIRVCGSTLTGRALREQILGTSNLKSPKIVSISCDGSQFTFTTRGFGHGVGMSQQGALGYAAYEGWDYRQILTHYYTGVTIR